MTIMFALKALHFLTWKNPFDRLLLLSERILETLVRQHQCSHLLRFNTKAVRIMDRLTIILEPLHMCMSPLERVSKSQMYPNSRVTLVEKEMILYSKIFHWDKRLDLFLLSTSLRQSWTCFLTRQEQFNRSKGKF